MFDRTYLPPASLEFVVVTDTHYMLDPGDRPLEFDSRRLQTARAEEALKWAAALETPLVVHLGDLVQEFPERIHFRQAMDEARAQLARCGVTPRLVAGNHDVGDKPDPTMPTAWVTPESLRDYHERYGRSWYSWDQAGVHFIVLNSQILNSSLSAASAQQAWLEDDLRSHAGARTILFLHLPLFLSSPQEPGLGHYDNVDEPARSWLLGLMAQYEVDLVFAAHVHFAFYTRWGPTRYFVVPSVSFTRPGFGELFASAPPPEQGRDDAPKLGFYLVRIQEEDARLHFIRTGGATSADDSWPEKVDRPQRLLTRTSMDLPQSPLGVVLRHPLAPSGEVPMAWPSLVRQPVRNDYPFLACLELGVRHVRIPATDLADPLQRQRLALLRAEGVQVTPVWLWRQGLDWSNLVAAHRERIDGAELQFLGSGRPDAACLRQIRRCAQQLALPVTLSTAIPGRQVPGKQHSRTQLGYRPDELDTLNHYLAEQETPVDRVLCRIDPANAWATMTELSTTAFSHIGALDWILELPSARPAASAALALFAAALLPASRLFLEPLVDLDRTMDVVDGLLDRLCNPRPVFHALRCLNTLLYSRPEPRHILSQFTTQDVHCFGLGGRSAHYWLCLPQTPTPIRLDRQALGPSVDLNGAVRCFPLASGQSQLLAADSEGTEIALTEATLLVFETGNGPN